MQFGYSLDFWPEVKRQVSIDEYQICLNFLER